MSHNAAGNSNGIIRVSDIRENLMRRFDVVQALPLEPVSGRMSIEQQADAIQTNYATFALRVATGTDDWLGSCPYDIADWLTVLTPAEFGAWQDIRCAGLPLWPRLPVGDFTVSFGNPVAKIALQCGSAHDDLSQSLLRADHWLTQIGWRVFRVSFAQCLKVMDTPEDVREREGEVSDAYRAKDITETLAGTMKDLRHALIATGVTC